jgi:hypothetical protein
VALVIVLGGLAFVSSWMHAAYEVERGLSPTEVPAAVYKSFNERFPGAEDVNWEQDDEFYEAEFVWRDREVESIFLEDGSWQKTEMPCPLVDLPEALQLHVSSLDGFEVEKASRVTLPDSEAAFLVELVGSVFEWEYLFDADGKLIARHREGPDWEERDPEDDE